MASSSNIDALPYYDKQVENPAIKSAAQALIEAELRKTPQISMDDPRLPPDVQVFPKSTQLQELLDGYPSNSIRGIDTSKYTLPPLEGASLSQLEQAEKIGRIGEGHMAIRQDNIALLSTYAPNAYLIRNYQLQSQLTELQATLAGIKEEITDVNRGRRVYQEEQGKHLSAMENRWQDLVGGTVQLEMACKAMEGEVRGLREKEEALRKDVEG
ncbi:pre-mRNA-splicing factor SPF27, partial [Tremellales sp. Uapishka_1]